MRRMAFGITEAEIPRHWVADSKFLTHWFNALSAVFPEGEKFFIDSVRQLEHRIQDPTLLEQVRGFIGQEGHHTHQHRVMNDVMRRHGLDATRYERRLKWFLDLLRRYYPKRWQLAVTCAIEHFTAIMGHQLLAHDYELPAMHPAMAPLWRWHAVEETEHKAVCFDVYRQVGGGYLRRVLLMVSTTMLFFPIVWSVQLGLMKQDETPTRLRDVLRGVWYLWGAPGPLRRMIPDYLRYYAPRFHPWQHENAALVHKWLSDERTAPQIRG
jgi:predicted metal-dependent hydrolase